MGGGGSSNRRVTFETDENENITVVKGVRLSDSVIDRMKEPSSPSGRPQSQHRPASGAANDEELKKRIAEELALERARRDSEAQKRRDCSCCEGLGRVIQNAAADFGCSILKIYFAVFSVVLWDY